MSLATVVRSESKLLLPTYDRQRVLFERGRGVYLWDSKGKRYLDFLSGIGVNALGHGHPVIQSTLKRQAGRLIHVSNLFFHKYQAELAKRLTRISGLDKAFFCNSGTEAWEGALKLARAFARTQNNNGHKAKWRLLALENSFHGRTFGSLATTGQEKYRHPFAPLVPGVGFVVFNDVDDLKRQFDGSVCAICLETIQGEGGIRPLSPEFLATARQLCDRTGALLILDEIQCGLGRTGKYFAYQQYGIQPDIVTVAKPLAAGLPLGALLTTDRVASGMHPGMHGTTFGGGPLACAVAIEFLRVLDGMLGHIRQTGDYFHAGLEGLKARHEGVIEIRGTGLMLGMSLDSADRAKAVVAQLLARGILINRTQDTVLRFLPPYIIQKAHVDLVVRALDAALTSTQPKTQLRANAKPGRTTIKKKEPITLSSQPVQTTQVATPPATAAFSGRDRISIRDLSPLEIENIFHLAGLLKARPSNFRTALAGKQMVMFFEKQSLRTRLTFEAGMASMGGNAFFMDQTAGRLDAREKLSDIAHNVERWVDAIVLRTYSHGTVEGMAEHACIPVINALSDLEHPCQALADYFTLLERFGDLKKICVAYVGDGNNVAHSLLLTAATLGSKIRIATPEEYGCDAQVVADAREVAQQTGAVIEILTDPQQAVDGADAIYTDAWTSMGHEHEEQQRNQVFPPYQVNEKLAAHAAPQAIFMHCLPAHRNLEITDAIMDSDRSVVFDQAESRLHVQKAILLLLLGGKVGRSNSRNANG